MIKLFVPGVPVSQGDLTATRTGRLYYQNHKTLDPWRYDIAWRARKAMRQARFHVHDGPVIVDVSFVMHRPKATPKRRATPPAIKKPDLDKLQRAILDAMTSHVYQDDSQVVEIHARKRIAEAGEPCGAVIVVEFLP
jgi:crossover junction endodeoxyribonuclease RusA